MYWPWLKFCAWNLKINLKKNDDLYSYIILSYLYFLCQITFGKPVKDVYSGVQDGTFLGSGISGIVRLCTHTKTGIEYAVECLDLSLIEKDHYLQQLRDEIHIMFQLDHPNIVQLEEVYESVDEIYLVQELCTGGEVFDRLEELSDYRYTEHQCSLLVKQMLR